MSHLKKKIDRLGSVILISCQTRAGLGPERLRPGPGQNLRPVQGSKAHMFGQITLRACIDIIFRAQSNFLALPRNVINKIA